VFTAVNQLPKLMPHTCLVNAGLQIRASAKLSGPCLSCLRLLISACRYGLLVKLAFYAPAYRFMHAHNVLRLPLLTSGNPSGTRRMSTYALSRLAPNV
jgi:hypothetical protein